jgi:hypothetical protein
MPKPKPLDTENLPDLIEEAHRLANEFIDRKVDEIRGTMPGVPPQTIRAMIEQRGACPCYAALSVMKEQP